MTDTFSDVEGYPPDRDEHDLVLVLLDGRDREVRRIKITDTQKLAYFTLDHTTFLDEAEVQDIDGNVLFRITLGWTGYAGNVLEIHIPDVGYWSQQFGPRS